MLKIVERSYQLLITCRIVSVASLLTISIMVKAQKYINPAGGLFPIVAWYSVEPGYITKNEYQMMRNANFTLSLSCFLTKEETLRALQEAKGTGIKLIVDCQEGRLANPQFINEIRNNESLGLYYLSDEPNVDYFPILSRRTQRIRENDTTHPPYINLLPIYASHSQMKAETYKDYVVKMIEMVNPPFISFDHYPFYKDTFRRDFFTNLEVISAICKERNKVFWAFVRTLPNSVYSRNDEGRLRFQVFMNLAYGAQGIQYFTYSPPKGCRGSIVDSLHRKTALYNVVSTINREVQTYAKYFLNAEALQVNHTDKNDRNGLIYQKTIKQINAKEKGLVLSFFKSRGVSYLLVVNKDYSKGQDFTVIFKRNASVITKKGYLKYNKDKFNIKLKAGDGLLFQFH